MIMIGESERYDGTTIRALAGGSLVVEQGPVPRECQHVDVIVSDGPFQQMRCSRCGRLSEPLVKR
jgi:hypothetical protein